MKMDKSGYVLMAVIAICLMAVGLIVLMIGVLMIACIGLPLLIGDPRYKQALAQRKYDLECAIIGVLRLARISSGNEWMDAQQVADLVGLKLGKNLIGVECKMVLNSLVKKKVVSAGEFSGKLVYRLLDGWYVSEMPQEIEKFE